MLFRHPNTTQDPATDAAATNDGKTSDALTNDAARRAPRRVALGVALALGACGAAPAQTPAASPSPSAAKPAATKPAQAGARKESEPAAAKGSRARRVGDGEPGAAAESKVEPTPVPESKSPARRAESSPTSAAKDNATKDGATKNDATKDDAAKDGAAKNGAAENDATIDGAAKASESKASGAKDGAGVESELGGLRARIKGARPEERGRLQRELVERLVALDRKAEAQDELRLMIHEDRYDPAFFFNTGNALARLGDANAAADAYRKAVAQRRGNYARALNNLGVVLTRQGRWDEAHEVLTAALTQENFTYAEASYNLGRLHLLRGQINLAAREWARTLRLQPGHTEAAAALARAYAEDGDHERALSLLEAFTARAAREGGAVPREIAYARAAVVDSMNRGDDDDAKPAADAPGARPGAASTAGAPGSSRNVARGARPFGVDRLTYDALQAARSAGERGRAEDAVRHYRAALSRSGGYLPPASLELGFTLITLGRDAEAAAALQSLIAREPTRYPVAHYHLARLHERAGDTALAARHFARAAELYGDANPQVLLDLSRTREKIGDARGALAALEAYARATARQGSVPDWVAQRRAALTEKTK